MRSGLTFLEILLTIASMTVLIAIGLTVMDPERILAERRDYQRQNHISNIQVAIDSYRRNNRGSFPEGISTNPASPSAICMPNCSLQSGYIDIYDDIAVYLDMDTMPQDPRATNLALTGYQIYVTSNGSIIVSAPLAEEADEVLSTQE